MRNVERLLSLALTLTSTERGLAREELVALIPGYGDESQNTTRRQFARDIQTLSRLGYEVVSEKDALSDGSHRYRIAHSSDEADVTFTPGQSAVVAVAARFFSGGDSSAIAARVRAKLVALGVDATSPIRVREKPSSLVTGVLVEAVTHGRRLSASYATAGKGEPTERRFEPWKVLSGNGREYVYAFDTDRKEARLFRLSRFTTFPKDVGQALFPRGETPPLEDLLVPGAHSSTHTFTVSIAPGKATHLREEFDLAPEDDTARIHTSIERISGAILRSLPWVHLIEPAWAVEEVEATIERVRALHAGESAHERIPSLVKPAKTRTRASGDADLITASALIAHVAKHPGVHLAELGTLFDLGEAEVRQFLDLIYNSGDYSAGLDDLVDVEIHDSRVDIPGAEDLLSPARLTSSEASSLLLGLEVAEAALAAFDPEDVAAVRRTLESIAGPKVVPGGDDSHAGDAHGEEHAPGGEAPAMRNLARTRLSHLIEAARKRRVIRMVYSLPDRDGVSVRDVEVYSLESAHGDVYVHGMCHLAGGPRVFRADRILALTDPAAPDAPETGDFTTPLALGNVRHTFALVRLEAPALWIAEAFHAVAHFHAEGETATWAKVKISSVYSLATAIYEARGAAEVIEPPALRRAVHALPDSSVRIKKE